MPMYSVLTALGQIVARSRDLDVATSFLAPGLVLLLDGEPIEQGGVALVG